MLSSIFKGQKVSEDLDEAYPVRKDVDITLHSKFRPRRKKRLTEDKWRAAFNSEGRLVHMNDVLDIIRRGGVEPKIRREVWEVLLGAYEPNSTKAERDALRKARKELYSNLKLECNLVDPVVGAGVVVDFPRVREDGTDVPVPANCDNPMIAMLDMSMPHEDGALSPMLQHAASLNAVSSLPRGSGSMVKGAPLALTMGRGKKETREEVFDRVGPEKVRKWRLGLHQIGVDVNRADRTLQFYEEEGNRVRLMSVLALYSWFDAEVGYCQGMGDLMSPMIVLFDDNSDAFWCFERLMRKVRSDFIGTSSSLGVQSEINRLAEVMKVYCGDLFVHLDEIGASSLFFTVRAIMTQFRREVSFADALYLWEMQWAWEFNPEEVSKWMADDKAAFRGVSKDPVKGNCRLTFLEDWDAYDLKKTIQAYSPTSQLPSVEGQTGEAGASESSLSPTDDGASIQNSWGNGPSFRSQSEAASSGMSVSGPLTSAEKEKVAKSQQRKKLTLGSVYEDKDDVTHDASARGGVSAVNGGAKKSMNRSASLVPQTSLTKELINKSMEKPRARLAPRISEIRSGKGLRATIRWKLHLKEKSHKEKSSPKGLHMLFPKSASRAPPAFPRDESTGWMNGMEMLEEAEQGISADTFLKAEAAPEVGEEEQHLTRLNTFCVLAVLAEAKDKLMTCDGMDDVVDIFNEEASLWDVKKLCKSAKEVQDWYRHWILGIK